MINPATNQSKSVRGTALLIFTAPNSITKGQNGIIMAEVYHICRGTGNDAATTYAKLHRREIRIGSDYLASW
jgi:hypothetical protein